MVSSASKEKKRREELRRERRRELRRGEERRDVGPHFSFSSFEEDVQQDTEVKLIFSVGSRLVV